MVKRFQGIEMDQKVIAMMNSTITSPKVREQCYAWRKEIAGFKVAIKKTRQQAAKLGKAADKHGERMLLFQKFADLSRRLLATNKKLVEKLNVLDMGDKAKEMLENPDWFELLCDKDDLWALNDLRSARLKIKKVKRKAAELDAYGTQRTVRPKRNPNPNIKGKHNQRNRENKALLKAGKCLRCKVGNWDRKSASCSDKSCKKK